MIGEFQNPARVIDATPFHYIWRRVRLERGAAIRGESNTHSNGKIREDGAFGWSRGRWTKIIVESLPGKVAPPVPR